jgi:hypothetical protein
MNIIKDLISRIETRAKETKDPCKTYASEERAEVAAEKMAKEVAEYFTVKNVAYQIRPARYVVVYVPCLDRWTYGIDMSELLGRSDTTGGYLGFCKDIFTF